MSKETIAYARIALDQAVQRLRVAETEISAARAHLERTQALWEVAVDDDSEENAEPEKESE